MYQTWHTPLTLLELESPKRGAVGRRNWVQQLGPPHRPPLGGSLDLSHLASPGTTYPSGNRLPLVRRPLPSGRRLGRGDNQVSTTMWGRNLFWVSFQNQKIKEHWVNSPSTTTSWHTFLSCMHQPHTQSASPEQVCLSLAHHWQVGMHHYRWPCALGLVKI